MANILICDDERDIVSALRIYLATEGHTLFEAYTGKQALDMVKGNDIHLVLMDIMMPEMDGIAATAKLREEYNIPIILLTAKSEDTDKVLGLNVGADDYITKPFSPREVLARIKAVLRRMHEMKTQDQSKKPTRQEVVAECALYIQAHLGDENLNVNEIGAHFYMNPVYLSRIFKQEKGVSINQWIIAKRMELARELLKDPNLTAVAVANHCGYYNYPYFSTVFKKYYGYAPSQSLGQDRDPTEN